MYMKRWFKICLLPAPSSPTLWHQPTREGLEKKIREGIKWNTDKILPGAASVLAWQLKMLIFYQKLPRALEEELNPEWYTVGVFYWLNLVFWWEFRSYWLRFMLAAIMVEFSWHSFCIAAVLRPSLAGCVSCNGMWRKNLVSVCLALASHKTWHFGVPAPFLEPIRGLPKDNRCGVKVLSRGNPMFNSGEGFGWFPEMWPRSEI